MSSPRRALLAWLLPSVAAWIIGTTMIARAGARGVFSVDCSSKGTVCPGSVRDVQIWMTVNLLILCAVMRPLSVMSVHRRLGRAAATAFGLTLAVAGLGMHGGADVGPLFRWSAGVEVVLAIASIVAFVVHAHMAQA